MARYAINVGSSAGLDLVEENSLPRTPRPSPYPHITGVSGPHPADLVEITSLRRCNISLVVPARAFLRWSGGKIRLPGHVAADDAEGAHEGQLIGIDVGFVGGSTHSDSD